SFYVYPNPVQQGSGTIRFQPGRDSDYTIRVFSVAGQLVDRFRGSAPGGPAPSEMRRSREAIRDAVSVSCRDEGRRD
ncbi:MAG: hypothetical protein R6V19_14340, partial [Armatimonadota bacterium]